MKDSCRILYQGGTGEIEEKKSRFIAHMFPVTTEEQALEQIGKIKKQYWDASHNCFAFVVGDYQELVRCSDDGEPLQTAGRPMLEVLLGQDIHNACVVVTRYFGGTLLGTGGLVRAYQAAVKEALSRCEVLERLSGRKLLVTTDYSGLGRIQYVLAEQGVTILESSYESDVKLTLLMPLSRVDQVKAQLVEVSSNRCGLQEQELVQYGVHKRKIVFFEGNP